MKQNFGRRPLRLGRVFEASPLYFVTFCTHGRIACLARDDIYAAFVLFAHRAERDFNVAVGHCVGLLKHIFVRTRRPPRVSRQFWQEGFFDHVMRNDESYSQKWNYVRENPVRAGFVNSAEEWPYQGEIVYIDRA